jgi:hypothetical protein
MIKKISRKIFLLEIMIQIRMTHLVYMLNSGGSAST